MRAHGVFLRLEGRRCVVVGGDGLAVARALACASAGGRVTVVSEVLGDEARRALLEGGVAHVARAYRPGDLAGAVLAYASTRDPDLIAVLRKEATAEGVLLNVVDVPDACDFFAGAVVERGPVTILVGTGGTAPAAAGVVRGRIEGAVGFEYGALATVMGAVRAGLATHPDRAELLRRLARSALVDHLRDGDVAGAERLIEQLTGASCSLATLDLGRRVP
jgi:siroheme synthase-like protein